jgi:hypothetical protein
MTEHVMAWLGAYHDGELQGRQLRQVEAHLADCGPCRAELEGLQALATLLQESPAAGDLTPPDRFVAQVGLRLPRRPKRPAWQRALYTGWRLTPLGLLGAWAFVQATLAVAGVVLVALRLGLGGDLVAGLLPASPGGLWLAEIFDLSGAGLNGVAQGALRLLQGGGPLGWGVVLNLGSLGVIGLLYWSWLASWWARRRHRTRIPGH